MREATAVADCDFTEAGAGRPLNRRRDAGATLWHSAVAGRYVFESGVGILGVAPASSPAVTRASCPRIQTQAQFRRPAFSGFWIT